MRLRDIIYAECDLSDETSLKFAFSCKDWDIWSFSIDKHYRRIKQTAKAVHDKLIWC